MGTIYRREMLNAFSFPPADTILDVGCFDGFILSELPGNFKVGVDLSPVHNRKINQVQADACDLPFQNDRFDFVFALDVIEHIPDDQKFVRSLVRVLKPGGSLFLTTPSKAIRMTPPFLTGYIS